MSAQIEMEPTTEALMLLEAEHRDTVEAWGRIEAGIRAMRRLGVSAEAMAVLETDLALVRCGLGLVTQRNRWNG